MSFMEEKIMSDIDWEKSNICYIANEIVDIPDNINFQELRKKIEPWLTAVFQSEHLSLLLGTGLTTALCKMIKNPKDEIQAMNRLPFSEDFSCIVNHADVTAKALERGNANIEDDIRVANELLKGLEIQGKTEEAEKLKKELNENLSTFANNVLQNESNVLNASNRDDIISTLRQFLISFASRTATRDRLHIFTTNYDRFIEYALDEAGIYTIDRFVGKINPTMRMHKMEIDFHYNPPGIRGEPRYIEGVVRYTKIHGSFDWKEENGKIIRIPLPFGNGKEYKYDNPHDSLMIYPNSLKGIETVYFPYSELFRDFSSAICRPNSVLVTYGYGFGDSHINRIILDMMNILSTHLVIMSFDTANGRIKNFIKKCNRSQITLLIGNNLGNIKNLVDFYLPKAAIDRISDRRTTVLEKRGENNDNSTTISEDNKE